MADDGDADASADDATAPDEGEDELATVASVLDDAHARAILAGTAEEARSADELVETVGASRSTVYRRLRRLVDLDLVAERQELDPEGDHFKSYRARLDRVTVDLDGEGFDVRVDRRAVEDDAVDRLNRLHERLTR